MPTPATPPYSLPPHRFRFRALAAHAGRAPLGGAREVALACLMAARLADSARALPVPDAARAGRAAGASAWFAAVSLPAGVRAPLARLTEALERGGDGELAAALHAVVGGARRFLEPAGIAELERLVTLLRAR